MLLGRYATDRRKRSMYFNDKGLGHIYGGPIVAKCDSFILRDDSSLREGWDQEEAYSLFRRTDHSLAHPYEREIVFGGGLEWAIEQATEYIVENYKIDPVWEITT